MLTHHATSSGASSQTFTPSFALQHQPQSLATAQELQLLMVTPNFSFFCLQRWADAVNCELIFTLSAWNSWVCLFWAGSDSSVTVIHSDTAERAASSAQVQLLLMQKWFTSLMLLSDRGIQTCAAREQIPWVTLSSFLLETFVQCS